MDNEQQADDRVRPPPHRGARPWVRLDPERAGTWLGTAGLWTLAVRGTTGHCLARGTTGHCLARGTTGHWLARGTTLQIVGRVAQPVLLEDVACGSLRVAVTVDGQPSASELAVTVAAIVDGAPQWRQQRAVHLRPPGSPSYFGVSSDARAHFT